MKQGVAKSLTHSALIDRLVHRCEIVPIEGESYRLKEAMARAEQKTAARAATPRKGKKV